MGKSSDSMRRLAESIIIFLEASEVQGERSRGRVRRWEKDYSWADGCIPLTEGSIPDEYIVVPDSGEHVMWPSWAPVAKVDDGKDWPAGTIQVNAIQPCSSRVARAYGAEIFSREMALLRAAIVTPDGRRRGISSPVARIGKGWRYASRPSIYWRANAADDPVPEAFNDPNKLAPGENSTVDTKFRIQEGLMLSLRYRWTATLRFDGTIGVRMMLGSPSAIPSLFRLRDLPPGRERRAVIRHWVETHWRASPADDKEMLALVRGHLRGGTFFRWSGMEIKVTPSAYDVERVAELKEWRDRMRASGLDRRPAR